MATTRKRNEVEAEMKEAIGIVPDFFQSVPEQYLDPEWQLFKSLVLGKTLLPNKVEDLMGEAKHPETKCRFCTIFHTETAILFEATDAEMQEAAHHAKMSLGWIAYLHGLQQANRRICQTKRNLSCSVKMIRS